MTDRPLQTAVLFIIFNRPYTTLRVFEAIRNARPARLYIAADGPRPDVPNDTQQCQDARKIIGAIDWECNVKTLFRQTNLNCGMGPASALAWFFSHEEEGIILEDDCLPSPSFFWFCQELLERYRHDSRVMHIGGNNFLNGWRKDKDYSYYFSRNGHIWGWATWRRAWEKFDYHMDLYNKVKRKGLFNNFFLNWLEKLYRLRKFEKTILRNGQVNWWDYQWDFARYIHSGLAIVPQVNLVKNIGFDRMATHTINGNSRDANLEAHDIDLPLRHPPYMIPDVESERRYFKNFIQGILLSKVKQAS